MKPGESVTVSVKVKNTGDREGTETLQLYIHDIAGSVVRPVKQLKGFERVILNAGEEKRSVLYSGRKNASLPKSGQYIWK